MYNLFPNFCFSCDNDEDVKLLHDASLDAVIRIIRSLVTYDEQM